MRFTNRHGIATLYRRVLGTLMLAAQLAHGQADTIRFEPSAVFDWARPGGVAQLRYPAPPGLVLDEVVDATPVGGGALESFGSTGNPRQLSLSIEPPFATSNLVVNYRLEHGGHYRVELGAVEIAAIEAHDERALVLDRSLAEPAAGMYLATALSNVSDSSLSLRAVRYLPRPYRPGRLLAAVTDDPGRALAAVSRTFSPSNLDAWERGLEERPEPLVAGFEWTDPASLSQELAPGETVVLVWTGDAFSAEEAPRSFSLRPVLEYGHANGSVAQLGLQTPVRSDPTGFMTRQLWYEPR